jgi:hypothetical protein
MGMMVMMVLMSMLMMVMVLMMMVMMTVMMVMVMMGRTIDPRNSEHGNSLPVIVYSGSMHYQLVMSGFFFVSRPHIPS